MTDPTTCRYCLSEADTQNMVSPCKCKGGIQYVHKECLLEWIKTKISQEHSCEICQTPYKLVFRDHSLKRVLFTQFFRLLCIYLFIGYIAYETERKSLGFTLCNGFVFSSFISGLFCMYGHIIGLRTRFHFAFYIPIVLFFMFLERLPYMFNKNFLITSAILFIGVLDTFTDVYFKVVYRNRQNIPIDVENY